ncbi:MAG: hypothetical protein NWP79_08925 [Paracoccaceae bacterium]|nr:hypothetical protein [Paracoccaceae bacterium]
MTKSTVTAPSSFLAKLAKRLFILSTFVFLSVCVQESRASLFPRPLTPSIDDKTTLAAKPLTNTVPALNQKKLRQDYQAQLSFTL